MNDDEYNALREQLRQTKLDRLSTKWSAAANRSRKLERKFTEAKECDDALWAEYNAYKAEHPEETALQARVWAEQEHRMREAKARLAAAGSNPQPAIPTPQS